MIKYLLLALLISFPLFAQDAVTDTPVVTTEAPKEEKKFNPRESHWVSSFGFEGLKYEVPFEFSGARKSFGPKDQELWGGRMGFGGEMYLGSGFNTTSKLEGYYVGTLFSKVLNAGPNDGDEDFAFTKQTGQVYGIDLTQSLGFMFDFSAKNPFMDELAYLTIEPFIEAGIGMARAYNRLNYDYDTGPSGVNEGYKHRVTDELLNTRIGGGINLTSTSGYFLYLKAYVNSFDITKRKSEIYSKPNQGVGSTSELSDNDAKIDPVTTYALGGGYKF